jgi:hypothetical protein
MNSKVGLMTPQEAKFFAKLIADVSGLKGFNKIVASLVFPALLDGIDNKIGDKLPEPWQTYAEDLITATYTALQDGVLSDEEIDTITNSISAVLGAEIHVPLVDQEIEIETFQYLLKYLASTIKGMIAKK